MARADSTSSKKPSSAPHDDADDQQPIDMSSAAIDLRVAGIQIMPNRRSAISRGVGALTAIATASLLPLKPAPAFGGVTPARNQLSRQIQRAIENYEAAEGYAVEMNARALAAKSEEAREAEHEAERMQAQRLQELEDLEAQIPNPATQLLDVFDRSAIAYMWTLRSRDAPDQMWELDDGDSWDKAAARLVLAVQQFQARLVQ